MSLLTITSTSMLPSPLSLCCSHHLPIYRPLHPNIPRNPKTEHCFDTTIYLPPSRHTHPADSPFSRSPSGLSIRHLVLVLHPFLPLTPISPSPSAKATSQRVSSADLYTAYFSSDHQHLLPGQQQLTFHLMSFPHSSKNPE